MALVNHAKKEINAKIVYYGPAGSGKKTALTYIYSRIKPSLRGELRTVPAGSDNLLFFDFSPFDSPLPNGYRFRLHVYTLTGAISNPATWKMTLKGADGILLMVNPAGEYAAVARESVSELRDFLSAYGVGLHETPTVLQLNSFTSLKDLHEQTDVAAALDLSPLAARRCNAVTGEGLLEALTALSRQVLDRISALEHQEEHYNPEEISELPAPPSTQEAIPMTVAPSIPSSETVSAERLPAEQPHVTINPATVSVAGTDITIPLDISCGSSKSRIVVTVSVAVG